jgi:uncharacterized protein YndB with AHSA1/START domain
MSTKSDLAPVRASVDLPVPPARAFELFTQRMSDWWPSEYAMVPTPRQVVVEPKKGGRWYEKGADGSEREVASVSGVEKPSRILFGWHIDGAWQYDPKLVTEVEVKFVPAGKGARVELEHRNMDRFGKQAETTRAALAGPGGWGDLLKGLAAFAKTAG